MGTPWPAAVLYVRRSSLFLFPHKDRPGSPGSSPSLRAVLFPSSAAIFRLRVFHRLTGHWQTTPPGRSYHLRPHGGMSYPLLHSSSLDPCRLCFYPGRQKGVQISICAKARNSSSFSKIFKKFSSHKKTLDIWGHIWYPINCRYSPVWWNW